MLTNAIMIKKLALAGYVCAIPATGVVVYKEKPAIERVVNKIVKPKAKRVHRPARRHHARPKVVAPPCVPEAGGAIGTGGGGGGYSREPIGITQINTVDDISGGGGAPISTPSAPLIPAFTGRPPQAGLLPTTNPPYQPGSVIIGYVPPVGGGGVITPPVTTPPVVPVTPAVPEAATWVMMLGGLGVVGFLLRNRKAK